MIKRGDINEQTPGIDPDLGDLLSKQAAELVEVEDDEAFRELASGVDRAENDARRRAERIVEKESSSSR